MTPAAKKDKDPDPRITKRKVTMTSLSAGPEPGQVLTWEKVDYVREDILDAYLADARSIWQQVVVSDGYDAGPAGYDGATYVPEGLDHPLAHHFYPATDCKNCDHAPVAADGRKATVVRVEEG